MKIKSAAIQYQLKAEPGIAHIVTGYFHSYCLEALSCMDLYPNLRIAECEKEGYITDTGDFINRKEAYLIAEKAGQIKNKNEAGILYSYNVNY